MKQKEAHIKGDWFRMLLKDFEFLEDDINEDFIKNTPKEANRNYIHARIQKGVFKYYSSQSVRVHIIILM